MKLTFKIMTLVLLVFLQLGCAQKSSTLEGTASYRERIALPPNAVLEITLEDISIMDIKAPVIAQKRETIKGQVPLSFLLEYDPVLIKENHRYNLRAKIFVEEKPLFITDTTNAVLNKKDTKLNLMMIKVK